METELFLQILTSTKEAKQREVRRGVLQNDLVKAHMALGAEMTCEELERQVRYHVDATERVRQEQEERRQASITRKRLRQLQRQEAA